VTVFFWKGLFLERAFFGKGFFWIQKMTFSKKSRYPKKAVAKKKTFLPKRNLRILDRKNDDALRYLSLFFSVSSIFSQNYAKK